MLKEYTYHYLTNVLLDFYYDKRYNIIRKEVYIMVCKECAYFWQDAIDERPHCHFEQLSAMDIPPCACDDDDHEDEDYEYDYDYDDDVDESFYDPYSGCDCYD